MIIKSHGTGGTQQESEGWCPPALRGQGEIGGARKGDAKH